MAKARTPLLSLGARGKIADTLEFSRAKKQHRIRSRTQPSNPQTVDQQANRSDFAMAVYAWRNYYTHSSFVPSWKLYARQQKTARSGFNSFAGSVNAAAKVDVQIPFGDECRFRAAGSIWVTLIDPKTGLGGNSGGSVEIWEGLSPASLKREGARYPSQGKWMYTSQYAAGTRVYLQVFRSGIPRSGIYTDLVQA